MPQNNSFLFPLVINILSYFCTAGRPIAARLYWGRKVRTPKGGIAANGRRLATQVVGKDKCNRKYVQVML